MKKLVTTVLIILLMITSIAPAMGAETDYNIGPGTIALHLGSPLILDGEEMKSLDPDNPNVVPVIHKDRTLIPLRALAEHFGGEVSYNAVDREAIISYDGKDYIFPIDKNHYRIEVDGKSLGTVVFDTETLIMNNRTMVPLRVICEKVLGKTVGYMDRVITVGREEVDLDEKTVEGIKAKIGQALQISSLDELKSILGTMEEYYYRDDMLMEEGISDMPTMATDSEKSTNEAAEAPSAESSADGDYSSTNEQVEGVNESDVVKTDGKFIYVATSKSVKIYDARKGIPVLVDEIESEVDSATGEYTSFSDLYVREGRLVVLGSRNRFNNWIQPIPEVGLPENDAMISVEIMPYRKDTSYVYCGVYSISDTGEAELMKEVDLEGSLLSSRKKDDTLYLIVNKYVYYGYDDIILPMYRDSAVNEEFRQISYDSVMYCPRRSENNYLIVAAIDLEEADTPASINSFLGSGRTVYMSNDNLYIANTDYSRHWGQITNIARFSVDGMKVGFAGGGLVEGTILNQFSMDEYKNNLRVATSGWNSGSTNSIFILDRNMNEIGSIEDIAPGERLYSARFMGDMGYIVTFRQIDPLFVMDLSDPEDPEITGELKVPGFSNYLHPIGEYTLLGIGRDVDEDTGRQGGIKLSIFDVSDQGKPKEINSLILGDSGSYAEVLNNHKALMLNPGKDMLAFDASLSTYTDKYQHSYFKGAVVIEANEKGKLVVLEKISNEGIYASDVKRLLYIGDYLYYILDDHIRTFDIDTFNEMK